MLAATGVSDAQTMENSSGICRICWHIVDQLYIASERCLVLLRTDHEQDCMSGHAAFVDFVVVQLWKYTSKSAIAAKKRNFVEADGIWCIYGMYYVCCNFDIDLYYIRSVIRRLTLHGILPIIVGTAKKTGEVVLTVFSMCYPVKASIFYTSTFCNLQDMV